MALAQSLDSLYLRFGLEELNYRAHFDYLDNFILQIAGEKIFYMLHPRQAEHLYPLEASPDDQYRLRRPNR